MTAKVHFIDGRWCAGRGVAMAWREPTHGETTWEGCAASAGEVEQAVRAARLAATDWAARDLDDRAAYLHAYHAAIDARRNELSVAISRDTGKPLWESLTEIGALCSKIASSIRAHATRRAPVRDEQAGQSLATYFKPHGVVAVLGSFNLPAHLPNAHIIPALLAGNTVVFKPSEQAPLVADQILRIWESAGLPKGVLNMVQGGRETGELLVKHDGLDGVYFTGGYATGKAIHTMLAGHPERILALEMGGNNPLGVWSVEDLSAAVYWTIQSAFITSGQRCTCARRLIIGDDRRSAEFLRMLVRGVASVRVGAWDDRPEPFMGPVISISAATGVLDFQRQLKQQGGEILLESKPLGTSRAMLSPGIVDVTAVTAQTDVELFGPLLQVVRVPDFAGLVREANQTAFGLAAGLLSDDRQLFEQFRRDIRAGIVNWNRATTGASGGLPFGGVGLSGNHRPSGYYAADYCSYPIASVESPLLERPPKTPPGLPS